MHTVTVLYYIEIQTTYKNAKHKINTKHQVKFVLYFWCLNGEAYFEVER